MTIGITLVSFQAIAYGMNSLIGQSCVLAGGNLMRTWTKPKIVEIAVGLEINSYACAD